MKKAILFALLLWASAGLQAQTVFKKCGNLGLGATSAQGIVAGAASLANTMQWGYTEADINGLGGLGTGKAGTFGVAILMPVDELLANATINGVSVPFSSSEPTEVSVFIAAQSDVSTPIVSKAFSGKVKAGYNTIALDEPYALKQGESVYVGYTFTITAASTQTAQYPILIGGSAEKGGLTIMAGGQWDDLSSEGYGNSGLQVLLAGVNLPANNVTLTGFGSVTGLSGREAKCLAAFESTSSNAIKSLTYAVEFQGQTATHDIQTNVSAGFGKKGYFSVPVSLPASAGTYPVKLTLTKVNGVDVKPQSLESTVQCYVPHRNTVVEELTGTQCPWCPRGWVGMEYLKKTYPHFIGIAVHQYNSSDPMYNVNYANLKWSGAPGCFIDRASEFADPYYGEGYNENIEGDFHYYASQEPSVDIEVSGTFQPAMDKVDAKAKVSFLKDCSKHTIVYVLTADDLTCPAGASATVQSRWQQWNNYSGFQPEEGDFDPTTEIGALGAKFCKGGEYGVSKVSGLVFNDVMVGSSYSSAHLNQASGFPTAATTGETAEHSYTVKLTAGTYAKAALDYEKVYVVAMVLDSNGHIANAAKAKVQIPEGIGTVLSDTSAASSSAPAYDLQGRAATAASHGIVVKDGKKLLVK